MKEFREKIKKRVIYYTLIGILSLIFAFLLGGKVWDNPGIYFIDGLAAGLGISFLFFALYYVINLFSKERIRTLYIKETDERNILIRQKVGEGITYIFPVVNMFLSIFIILFLDASEGMAIGLVTIVFSFLTIILKFYYSKKL